MSGYAASARLRGGSTRFVAVDSVRRVQLVQPAWTPPASPDAACVDLVGGPLRQRLAERWDELRETWSQTTFFLFDPESWR